MHCSWRIVCKILFASCAQHMVCVVHLMHVVLSAPCMRAHSMVLHHGSRALYVVYTMADVHNVRCTLTFVA